MDFGTGTLFCCSTTILLNLILYIPRGREQQYGDQNPFQVGGKDIETGHPCVPRCARIIMCFHLNEIVGI